MYEPHEKQKIFIESPLKRKIIRAGRRGGKTTGVAIYTVVKFSDSKRILYTVPTTDQLGLWWPAVVISLAEPIELGILRKYESDHIIEVPGTEQRIKGKTAWNADTLRGDYADVLIFDEWQMMNEDAWEVVGLPMLMDRNGEAVFIYTPPSLRKRVASKAQDPRHAAKLFKKAEKDPRWLTLHWTSRDNPHLSREGITEVLADLTELSRRQEIEAEDIDEVPGALWQQKLIDDTRVSIEQVPALARVVVGVDPPGGATECGICAAGLGVDGEGYVLEDASDLFKSPREWAARATWVFYSRKADRILGEQNYGGDMVESTIKIHDEHVSYKSVNATRGKIVRAEPIAALYEKHVIHHAGTFPKLEEEMCSYVPGNKSPNRMDALVWALTELFPERVRLTLAGSIVDEMEKRQKQTVALKVQKENLAKPATNDQTKKCEQCGSPLLVQRGTITHCNSCGHEVGFTKPDSVPGRAMLK